MSIQHLELRPGDQIVITSNKPLSSDIAKELKATAEERWPGHLVSVLQGVEMTVVTAVER